MTVAERRDLDRRHRRMQQRLAATVGYRLAAVLANVPNLDQATIDAYLAVAFPTVAGGQQAAATAAAGYVGAVVPEQPRGRRAALNIGRALAGVLVTRESRSLVAPMLRARRLVGEGQPMPEALHAAGAYATSLSSYDLQAAQRAGISEGARAAGARVEGWRKELGPQACTWCVQTAQRTYGDADAVPFHDNDRCSVAPVLAGDEEPEYVFSDDDIPF